MYCTMLLLIHVVSAQSLKLFFIPIAYNTQLAKTLKRKKTLEAERQKAVILRVLIACLSVSSFSILSPFRTLPNSQSKFSSNV